MRTKTKLCYFLTLYLALAAAMTFSILAVTAEPEEPIQPTNAESERGKTFLLLGIDRVSYSSDVILVAHIDSDGEHLKLLQLPRDSYTASGSKLNSVFAVACTRAKKQGKPQADCYLAGAGALSDFLESALGIRIDSRAVLTLQDFRTLVDSVGGVPINLPKDLDYDDPTQELSIHLKAGEQILDGKAAEGFVRCRNAYVDADYGRMDAQKLFMSAFYKKLRYNTSPKELFSFIKVAHSALYTDISLKESLSIGASLLTAKGEALLFATCKGESVKIGSLLYEVLPCENLQKASLWLEGDFSESAAKSAFCSQNEQVAAIFSAPAKSKFCPHAAKELEGSEE